MTPEQKLKAALAVLLKLRPYFKDPHDKRRVLLASAIELLQPKGTP